VGCAIAGERAGWGQQQVLRVAVVLKENGSNAPVKDGLVKLYMDTRQYSAVSGEDGVATFELPQQEVSRVTMQAAGDGWVNVQASWARKPGEAMPGKFEMGMEKATEIGGIVTDQEGKPLGGATVMVQVQEKFAANPTEQVAYIRDPIMTDEAGKWSYFGVPAKFDGATLGAMHPECLGQYGFVGMEKFADLAGLHTRTAQLKLERGTPVDIEVRGPDGHPVPDAMVGYGGDRVASNVLPAIPVDLYGKLRLGVKPGTTAVLTVRSPMFAPELKSIAVGKEPVKAMFDLNEGKTLTGRVVDKEGNGVGGLRVYFETWRQTRTLDKSVTTDGAGNFQWDHAPADEIKVDVLGREYAPKRGVSVRAGQENVIAIFSPTLFHGIVVDETTERPVKGFKIVEGVQFDNGKSISFLNPVTSFKLTGKEGEFELSLTEYEHVALRVIADGYMPADSNVFDLKGEKVNFTYKLKKAANVEGVLVDGDGKPVKGVHVYLAGPGEYLNIDHDMQVSSQVGETHLSVTDADGKFAFPAQVGNYQLIAIGEEGFANMKREEFEKEKKLKYAQWATIEGEVREGTKPMAGAKMMLQYQEFSLRQTNGPMILMSDYFDADNAGKFIHHRVFGGMVMVSVRNEIRSGNGMMVGPGASSGWTKVVGGTTTHLQIGGKGRTVIGHLSLPSGVADDPGGLNNWMVALGSSVQFQRPVAPLEVMEKSTAERQKWEQAYWKSDEGKVAFAKIQNQVGTPLRPIVAADRTFRISDVESGTYQLTATFGKVIPGERGSSELQRLAIVERRVVVPTIPGGVSDEPLDLGDIQLETMKQKLDVGSDASELRFPTPDGKEMKISDFKGKYLALDLWMPYSKEFLPDRAALGAMVEKYGKSGEFALLGICMDSSTDAMKVYLDARPMAWPQVMLGSSSTTLYVGQQLFTPDMKGLLWLIGPDGKVMARDLDMAGLKAELEKVLGK
jgi:protocatechuate 3,4-dioxygenase beta subunit